VEGVDNRGCQLLADVLLYAVEVVEQGVQHSQQAQPLLSYAPAWVIYRAPSCVSEKASNPPATETRPLHEWLSGQVTRTPCWRLELDAACNFNTSAKSSHHTKCQNL
jgi:hypothetical protein